MKSIPKVEQVMMNVNDNCFFKCQMCSIWKKKDFSHLSLNVYGKFFKDLTNIKGSQTQIQIAGGEPLVNKDIYDIINLSTDNGLYTGLNTNSWLLNEKNILKLFNAKLNFIMLSLDGSSPKVHDFIRQKPRSFNKVMKVAHTIAAYNKKSSHKIEIGINTVLSELNLHDAINIVNLIDKTPYINQIWLQAVSAPLAENTIDENNYVDDTHTFWYEHDTFDHLWPKNKTVVKDTFTELIHMKKKGSKIQNNINRLQLQYNYFLHPDHQPKNCQCTMFKDVMIENNGDVYLCPFRPELIGNIKINNIHKLWVQSKTKQARSRIIKCNKNCHILVNCGLPKNEKTKL